MSKLNKIKSKKENCFINNIVIIYKQHFYK